MSDYRFDFNVADMTLDEMNAVNGRVKNALADMEAQVERSLADWTGVAQDAYWSAKAEWNRQAAQMPVYLEAGRKTLLSISDNYGTTEQRAKQIWDSSRG
ncbi:WXG100 family type VII secretion target [Saccharopolyspora antimicrobica]|uniref:WXG100 family type VII secretion target n=1 Tax=Saccharopolyspora antimicrobica TaxID=455193 RepID=A0A1I5B2K2_9PSEU|nr:WXG100 family type VII secretion target [Saccharopolyspora antimicrobica]RKT86445.1 WXG100 family type VII secretion target [Saccharopolyspora antimicrobica]SFN68850.1 WXG100 family type VII secretion target [Saccharopolyspora antimicrobica]